MRKMRKALSFVLVLALVLSSFSVVFGAGTTLGNAASLSDVSGLPGEEQINVCQNLGIIEGFPDGTFGPDQLVNRAQFAAMITRAMGIPDTALTGYTVTTFQDTAGYGWAVPYLAFCQSKNIMIGDGYGNAMPGRTISVNEAMTMILRAIGYTENSEELVGKWPANYVTMAKQQQLYDDLVGNETYMDRQNAAIALYNGLTIQLVYVDLQGRTEQRWTNEVWVDEEGVSHKIAACLANSGLGCTVQDMMVEPGLYGNSLINIANKIGAFGLAFINKDDLLIAFKQTSTFLTGCTTNTGKFDADDGKTYVFDKYNKNITPAGIFWNADIADGIHLVGGMAPADLIDEFTYNSIDDENITDGAEVTLSAKVTGGTIKHIYAMIGYAATATTLATDGILRTIDNDQELLNYEFVLDDDQDIDLKQFQLFGADSLDELKADDVIYVYVSDGDEVIRKVAVGTEVVEGVIDESSDSEFIVDGDSYSYASKYLAECFGDPTSYKDVFDQAGADVVARLDAYGYAYDIDMTGGEMATFGLYVTGSASGDARGNYVRYFTQEESETGFDAIKSNKIDWYPSRPYTNVPAADKKTNNPQDYETANLTDAMSAMAPVDTLYGYKLNKDGLITAIEKSAAPAAATVKSRTVLTVPKGAGTTDVTIAKNAVIFGIAAGEDTVVGAPTDFDLSWAKDNPDMTNVQYILNAKGDKVIAMRVPLALIEGESDDVFAVINSDNNLANKAKRYTGYIDGKSGRIDSITDGPDWGTTHGITYEYVTLYMMTRNGDGKVKKIVDLTTDGGIRFLTGETNGAFVLNRAPGDTNYNFITLASGDVKIPVESDVIVYKAEYDSGDVTYTKATVGSAGVSSIKGDAYIWAYCTKKKADIDNVADVVIWMTKQDVEDNFMWW